ncbi:MAG: helicase HerA domain-containing protein, partial [Bdellovibrionota bacterium]
MSERISIDPRLRFLAAGGLVFLGAVQISRWTEISVFLAGSFLLAAVFLLLGAVRFFADQKREMGFENGLFVGRSGASAFKLPFFEGRHTLITGITGSGKSTLIMRLISEVLKKGASFVYFDFKGEKSDHERLLKIADGKELLVFDLADLSRCVSCNFLTLFSGIAETVGIVADLLFEEDTPTYFKLEGSRFLRYALELLDGAEERRSFVRLEVLFQDDRY